MPHFDLNLLGALHALLHERNVTRAAEKCHVTQPTMSGMLQRLRYHFDDELLVRIGRAMELTPMAETLIEPVRNALHSVDILVNTECGFDPETSTRTFSIMASDFCTLIFFPQVVQQLAVIAPKLRIELRPLNAPIDHIQSGEVDICVTSDDLSLAGYRGDTSDIQKKVLFSDEFVCVVRKDHPLREPISATEYFLYPHVCAKLGANISTIDAASRRLHAPFNKPAYTVGGFVAIPHIVAESNLIGIIQRSLALLAAETLPIRLLTPPFAIPNINETLMWHPRNTADPAHRWLRNFIAREAAAFDADGKLEGLVPKPTAKAAVPLETIRTMQPQLAI